jgi:Tfp pilus assembly protein PilP
MNRSRMCARVLFPALIAAAALLFAACGGQEPPSSVPLPAVKPKPAAASALAAGGASGDMVTEWVYSPGKLRDPFARLIRLKAGAKKIDPSRLTPLQRFEIPALRLDAIMIMGKKTAAQVIAPDGKAYTLRPGTLVGPTGAKVRRITSDSVILVEEYEDFLGRKLQQETVIPLHKKEGENQP